MPQIIIHQEKAADRKALAAICPFGAIELVGDKLEISAGCRMCRLCIKRGNGVFELAEDNVTTVDKSAWRGVAVIAEVEEGAVHPVTFELIGKVYCLSIRIIFLSF